MQRLRLMLLGIFLAVLSVWCLIFGEGETNIVTILGVFLPIPAIICFGSGFSSNGSEDAERRDTSETGKKQDTNL